MTPNKKIIKSEIQNNLNDKNTLIAQNFFNDMLKDKIKNKVLPQYFKKVVPNTSRQEKNISPNVHDKKNRIDGKYITDSINNNIKNKAFSR